VAETEQEDKGSLLTADPEQTIKELKIQVDKGFFGV